MANLLVVYQEALHAATVLISEIIARVLKGMMSERTVVYGTASLLVVILEVLRVMTMLISEVIARVLTRGLSELTVVFGIANLLVVFQEVLHAVMILKIIAQAQTMERMIVSAGGGMAK